MGWAPVFNSPLDPSRPKSHLTRTPVSAKSAHGSEVPGGDHSFFEHRGACGAQGLDTDRDSPVAARSRSDPASEGPSPAPAGVQALAGEGLIAIEISEQEGWQHYSATAAGNARAKELSGFLREPVVHYLRQVVGWASTRSFEQLIRQPFDPGVATPEPSEKRSLHPR